MVLVLAGRPGTNLYISRADINIISIKILRFRKVALAQSVESYINQSAEGAGGLGIIRGNKVGESE